MNCQNCHKPIKKVPITVSNFFLPKVIDTIQCNHCKQCYTISSLAEWGYFFYFNGGFLVPFFIFIRGIQQLVDNFSLVLFFSYISLWIVDYCVARIIPLVKTKCENS